MQSEVENLKSAFEGKKAEEPKSLLSRVSVPIVVGVGIWALSLVFLFVN